MQILGLLAVYEEHAAKAYMEQLVPQTIRGSSSCDSVWQTVMEYYNAVKACWPSIAASVEAPAVSPIIGGVGQQADASSMLNGKMMGQGLCGDKWLDVQRVHRLAMMSIL